MMFPDFMRIAYKHDFKLITCYRSQLQEMMHRLCLGALGPQLLNTKDFHLFLHFHAALPLYNLLLVYLDFCLWSFIT